MDKKKRIIGIAILVVVIISILGLVIYKKLNTQNSSESLSNIVSNLKINKEDDGDFDEDNVTTVDSSSNYTITKGGVYTFTSDINGSITVETDENVKIVLNNVTITNSSGPAINVINAKNTYIELIGTNKIVASGTEDYDAAIYSADDLILQGSGTLYVESQTDGITSKDDLTINGGTYIITSDDDGIKGRDSVIINDGNINITAKGDGIKATNDEDTSKGYVIVNDGTIVINAGTDGIQAETSIIINDGEFDIKTGSGSTVTAKTNMFNSNTSTSDESMKGIKAGSVIEIVSGTITINAQEDALHSDGVININGGTMNLSASDDGIHADEIVTINGGVIDITASEGIEATYVKINDGTLTISASDDGINASNKSSKYTISVEINGGNITITMGQGDTDAIDSNGNLYINGGTLNITAQSPFDYDGEAKYSGGTMIVNGTKTTSITNQMMGGGQGMGQNQGMMGPGQRRR